MKELDPPYFTLIGETNHGIIGETNHGINFCEYRQDKFDNMN